MKKSLTSHSPLYQWLFDHGYHQTELRKNHRRFGTIAPLAKTLLPKIKDDDIHTALGLSVTKEQQVLDALCHIRNLNTRHARRAAAPAKTKTPINPRDPAAIPPDSSFEAAFTPLINEVFMAIRVLETYVLDQDKVHKETEAKLAVILKALSL
jgi:hypothetical protein